MDKLVLKKIISGGQTGADYGGLLAAKQLNLETGGYAPKEFMTEDGPRPELHLVYGLKEFNGSYHDRTVKNVYESTGTAIFATDLNSPGTRLTIKTCHIYKRPLIINPTSETLKQFCITNNIETLNIAGNRHSKSPTITSTTFTTIMGAFRR